VFIFDIEKELHSFDIDLDGCGGLIRRLIRRLVRRCVRSGIGIRGRTGRGLGRSSILGGCGQRYESKDGECEDGHRQERFVKKGRH
jgi:hypothetical protein